MSRLRLPDDLVVHSIPRPSIAAFELGRMRSQLHWSLHYVVGDIRVNVESFALPQAPTPGRAGRQSPRRPKSDDMIYHQFRRPPGPYAFEILEILHCIEQLVGVVLAEVEKAEIRENIRQLAEEVEKKETHSEFDRGTFAQYFGDSIYSDSSGTSSQSSSTRLLMPCEPERWAEFLLEEYLPDHGYDDAEIFAGVEYALRKDPRLLALLALGRLIDEGARPRHIDESPFFFHLTPAIERWNCIRLALGLSEDDQLECPPLPMIGQGRHAALRGSPAWNLDLRDAWATAKLSRPFPVTSCPDPSDLFAWENWVAQTSEIVVQCLREESTCSVEDWAVAGDEFQVCGKTFRVQSEDGTALLKLLVKESRRDGIDPWSQQAVRERLWPGLGTKPSHGAMLRIVKSRLNACVRHILKLPDKIEVVQQHGRGLRAIVKLIDAQTLAPLIGTGGSAHPKPAKSRASRAAASSRRRRPRK